MNESGQASDIKLHFFKPGGGAKVLTLRSGRYVVGRQSGATLRLPVASVSRKHCEFTCDGARVLVRDLNSSNGTYCNNERVDERLLKAGDIVGIGPFRIAVQIDGHPSEVREPDMTEPDMAQTPASGASAARGDAGRESGGSDLDETITKGPGLSSLLGAGDSEDSSIFDFDFDFEDDDSPKL